jgi:CRP-like cAMP-binding protein
MNLTVSDPVVDSGVMQHDDLWARWAENPVFASAGDDVCRRLAETHLPARHPAGAVLAEEGDPADHVAVVLEGTVKIYHQTPDGREVVVKLLRAPCVFGDLELLAGLPLVKNVSVVEEVQLAVIPAQAFLELLQRSPAAMLEHLRQLAGAFCVAVRNQRLVFTSLEQRVANLLLSYADLFGRQEEGGELVIEAPLSQQQLALALGAVRRSVANVLSAWSREDLLSKRGERYVLHRVERFEQLAAPIRGSLNYQMGMPLEQLLLREPLLAGALEVRRGPEPLLGRRLPVEGELMIGRDAACQLVLEDDLVSPRHCRVYRGTTGPRFWIEDLGSESGTRVNGGVVTRAVLREGDRIEVGGARLRFLLRQPAAEAE